jgi:hypothetical protein
MGRANVNQPRDLEHVGFRQEGTGLGRTFSL